MKIREKAFSDDFLIMVISYIKDEYGQDVYPGLNPAYIKSVFTYSPIDNGMFRISVTTTDPLLSSRIAQAFENLLPTEFASYSANALKAVPFNYAKTPTTPNDKGVLKNAVIGFVGGGVVSAVVVWLMYAIDTTVRNKKKLEDNFGYTILGTIPHVKN
jgi:capsular polysaccharide biosynthesis protein